MFKIKFDFLNSLENFSENAFSFAVFTDQTLIGNWDGEQFTFYKECKEENLRELTVFNENKQYKFFYSLSGKKWLSDITDNTSDKFFENDVFVKGKNFMGYDGNFSLIEEDGTVLALPIKLTANKDQKTSAKIRIRDYYDFDENNSLIHTGTRLVKFISGGENNV